MPSENSSRYLAARSHLVPKKCVIRSRCLSWLSPSPQSALSCSNPTGGLVGPSPIGSRCATTVVVLSCSSTPSSTRRPSASTPHEPSSHSALREGPSVDLWHSADHWHVL